MTGAVRGTGQVLLYVQHLMGVGHLMRAATLARACRDAGLDVTLVSGGMETPGVDLAGIRFVQLPPMRAADRYFKRLVDDTGREIDDAFKHARADALAGLFDRTRPHVLITELFPFGRRQLRFELLPLLDAALSARPRPRILCSVRDILVEPPRPERADEMLALVKRYYDGVLVHGDPGLIPFDATFTRAAEIADRIAYTGYVLERRATRAFSGAAAPGEVVVSAGGGAVGAPLLEAAMAARALTRLRDAHWRLLAGPALPEDAFTDLRRRAPEGVTVERARPDFFALLCNAALSISQGGYNTVLEVLAAGVRGVIVPYAGGLETEQTLRAELLRGRGPIHVVAEEDISPGAIAAAAEAALDGTAPSLLGLDIDGAAKSARIIAHHAAAVMERDARQDLEHDA